MDCTLGVWRVALPAGSGWLVPYGRDTPLQLVVYVHSNRFSTRPDLIDPRAHHTELIQLGW